MAQSNDSLQKRETDSGNSVQKCEGLGGNVEHCKHKNSISNADDFVCEDCGATAPKG